MIGHQKLATYPEALKKLEHYCAYQERCHQEVEKKLREYFLIPEAQEKIIMHLIAENYLNETRFAESFARGKFNIKHWGKLRIVRELKMRKISAYNIKKGLKQIDENDYLTSFHELADRKWENLSGEPIQKAKEKLINYLQYRGWENNLIFEKVAELSLK